jgi:hypothetical protein
VILPITPVLATVIPAVQAWSIRPVRRLDHQFTANPPALRATQRHVTAVPGAG